MGGYTPQAYNWSAAWVPGEMYPRLQLRAEEAGGVWLIYREERGRDIKEAESFASLKEAMAHIDKRITAFVENGYSE